MNSYPGGNQTAGQRPYGHTFQRWARGSVRTAHFTLVELLVAVSIIMVLLSQLIPAVTAAQGKGKYARWREFSNQLRGDDGLTFYLNMNESEGSTLENLAINEAEINFSPTRTNGTVTGATWLPRTLGRWNAKVPLALDGVDDFIAAGNGYDLQENCTVSMWVRHDPTDSGYLMAQLCNSANFGPTKFYVYLTSSGRAWAYFRAATTTGAPTFAYTMTSNASRLKAGEWTLLSFTFDFDAKTAATYINGSLDKSGFTYVSPTAAGVYPGSGPLTIGCHPWSIAFKKAALDEVAIWNRALEAEEIETIYRMGQP